MSLAGERILVVDDEPRVAQAVELSLGRYGYQISVAYTGEEALRAAAEQTPDLILLDLGLPDITGYEVCYRLRQQPATRSVPIIMLTAYGQTTKKVAGFEVGADDYITKPFIPAELAARVAAHLSRRL